MLAAKSDAAPPAAPERQPLLAADFDRPGDDTLGALRSPACDLGVVPGHPGRALRYVRRPPYRCALLLPARPSTTYSFARRRLAAPSGVDLVVVETRHPLVLPKAANHAEDVARLLGARFTRRAATIAVHRLADALTPPGKDADAARFETTPWTRSLVIIVADPHSDDGAPNATAWFDDLRLEALVPLEPTTGDPTSVGAAPAGPSPDRPQRTVSRAEAGFGVRFPGITEVVTDGPAVAEASDDTAPASPRSSPADPARPNLVLLTVSGLDATHLGCYGYPRRTTPAIDALAASSAVFEAAFGPGTSTRATLPALMTGLLPSQHGLEHGAATLSDAASTLASRLAAGGYVTAAMIADDRALRMGLDRGFGTFQTWPAGTPASQIVVAALAWISRQTAAPWFVHLHVGGPLPTLAPTAASLRRFVPPLALVRFGVTLPVRVTRGGWLRGCSRCGTPEHPSSVLPALVADLYDSGLADLDAAVGDLAAGLDRAATPSRTVVAVAGLYGVRLAPAEPQAFGHPAGDLKDDLLRVPLLLRTPGGGGRRLDAPVRSLDLVATLAALAGVTAPASPFSASLLPLLADLAGLPVTPRPIVAENARLGRLRIKDGDRSYWLQRGLRGPASERLYDLSTDPGELRDLLSTAPAALDRARRHALRALCTGAGHSCLLLALPQTAQNAKLFGQIGAGVEAAEGLFGVDAMLHSTTGVLEVGVAADDRRWHAVRLLGRPGAPAPLELSFSLPGRGRRRQVLIAEATALDPVAGLDALLAAEAPRLLLLDAPPPPPAGVASSSVFE